MAEQKSDDRLQAKYYSYSVEWSPEDKFFIVRIKEISLLVANLRKRLLKKFCLLLMLLLKKTVWKMEKMFLYFSVLEIINKNNAQDNHPALFY